MMPARQYLVSGKVQGVGFRYYVRERATTAGLTGWVRNLPDGRVEAHVEGPPAALDRFTETLREGPPAARVSRVSTRPTQPVGHRGFRITD